MLMVIAHHAYPDGVAQVKPTQLHRETELSVYEVQRAIAALASRSLIKIIPLYEGCGPDVDHQYTLQREVAQ